MRVRPCFFYVCAGCLLLALPARAQQPTPNTLALAPGEAPAAATFEDVAWIAGHWQGEALGGQVEEVWSPPFGGTMTGMFKLVHGGAVAFYEIMTIVPEQGSLILKLKHFNPDLTGWEEKGEVVSFPLVRAEPGTAYFDGMTFQQLGEDTIRVYLAIGEDDGSVREETFLYRRVRP